MYGFHKRRVIASLSTNQNYCRLPNSPFLPTGQRLTDIHCGFHEEYKEDKYSTVQYHVVLGARKYLVPAFCPRLPTSHSITAHQIDWLLAHQRTHSGASFSLCDSRFQTTDRRENLRGRPSSCNVRSLAICFWRLASAWGVIPVWSTTF